MEVCRAALPGKTVVKGIATNAGDIRHSRIDAIVFAQPWLSKWPGIGDRTPAAWCAVRLAPKHFNTYAAVGVKGQPPVLIVEAEGSSVPDIPDAITPDHDSRLAYVPVG
ncbi:MAG: hypothetical protein JWP14_2425 [Frankiales bacterium]|nr:hypothetical protein [Frankiales bacterium]